MPERPAERRRAAAVAGHDGDVDTARTLLGDVDPGVRATALGALHRAGALDDATLTTVLADDPAPTVRGRAVALAAGRPDVDLSSALHDPDPGVVEVAAFAAGERERPGSPLVAVLAGLTSTHRDPLVREAAVAALGAIGDPNGLTAVLAATADKAAVRRRAVLALAAFDDPEADAVLERALSDRDRQVRQAAEDLLGRRSQA